MLTNSLLMILLLATPDVGDRASAAATGPLGHYLRSVNLKRRQLHALVRLQPGSHALSRPEEAVSIARPKSVLSTKVVATARGRLTVHGPGPHDYTVFEQVC